MASVIIQAGNVLAAGLRSELDRTYEQTYDGVIAQLGNVVDLDMPSDKRTELYAMHRTMPYPEHWRRGNSIPVEATDTLPYTVTNLRWGKGIEWEVDDRSDNQIADLFTKAQQLGRHFASLDTRFFFQAITGAADLLPNVPNSPDGSPLYSATAEGSARFGITGGNIVTGTGITAAQITTDFFAATARQEGFLNTKGQPYFESDISVRHYRIYYNVANNEFFTAAFKALLVQGASAAPSSLTLANGVTVTLISSPRITDNDWSVFRDDAPIKAMFTQLREGLTQQTQTVENSDKARTQGTEGVYFKARKALGINVPFATVQVNNT